MVKLLSDRLRQKSLVDLCKIVTESGEKAYRAGILWVDDYVDDDGFDDTTLIFDSLRTAKEIAASSSKLQDILIIEEEMEDLEEKGLLEKELKNRDRNGDLPLHFAVQGGAPLKLVKKMVKVYPDAVKTGNNKGQYPLHVAWNSEPDVFDFILDEYPDATKIPDKYKRYPLHWAAWYCSHVENVESLCIESSKALRSADDHGRFPLHLCCFGQAGKGLKESLEVAKFVYNCFPGASRRRTNKKLLPIQIAMEAGNFTVAGYLFKEEPSILFETADGNKDSKKLFQIISDKNFKKSAHEFHKSMREMDIENKFWQHKDLFLYLLQWPGKQGEIIIEQPQVQKRLNDIMVSNFHTVLIMWDFYFGILVNVLFRMASHDIIAGEARIKPMYPLIFLLSALAAYGREIVEISNLFQENAIKIYDKWNIITWSRIACLLIMSVYCVLSAQINIDTFRWFVVVSTFFLWLSILNKARPIFLPISIFLSALVSIISTLVPFLLAFFLLLLTFRQMSYTDAFNALNDKNNIVCANLESDFCDGGPMNLRKTYDQVLNPHWYDDYDPNGGESGILPKLPIGRAYAIYFFFTFLMVIILLNVLIAIVSDAYEQIKDDGRAIFWEDRLAFIVEVQNLKKRLTWINKCLFHYKERIQKRMRDTVSKRDDSTWKRLRGICASVNNKAEKDFFLYLIQTVTIFISYVVCFVAGFLTFGFLWPRDMRIQIFCTEAIDFSMVSGQDELKAAIAEKETMMQKLVQLEHESTQTKELLKELIDIAKNKSQPNHLNNDDEKENAYNDDGADLDAYDDGDFDHNYDNEADDDNGNYISLVS